MSVPSPPWSQRDESHPGAGLGCSATWEGTSGGTHSWTQGSSGPSSLVAFVPISSTVGGVGSQSLCHPWTLPMPNPTMPHFMATWHTCLLRLTGPPERSPLFRALLGNGQHLACGVGARPGAFPIWRFRSAVYSACPGFLITYIPWLLATCSTWIQMYTAN